MGKMHLNIFCVYVHTIYTYIYIWWGLKDLVQRWLWWTIFVYFWVFVTKDGHLLSQCCPIRIHVVSVWTAQVTKIISYRIKGVPFGLQLKSESVENLPTVSLNGTTEFSVTASYSTCVQQRVAWPSLVLSGYDLISCISCFILSHEQNFKCCFAPAPSQGRSIFADLLCNEQWHLWARRAAAAIWKP